MIDEQPLPPEMIETFTLSRTDGNTFIHREALKALGMTWDGDTKSWTTQDRATYESAYFIVTGRPAPENAAASNSQSTGGQGSQGRETVAGDADGSNEANAQDRQHGSEPAPESQGSAQDVESLTSRGLDAAARVARAQTGQPFGDPQRMTKDEKCAKLREMVPNDAERQAIVEQVHKALGSASGSAQGSAQPQPAPQQASGNPVAASSQEQAEAKARLDAKKAAKQQALQPPKNLSPLEQAINDAVKQALEEQAGDAPELDEDRIREIAREEASKLDETILEAVVAKVEELGKAALAQMPQQLDVTVTIADGPKVDATGMHPQAPYVAACLKAGLNVALVGKPAVGKTHVSKDVATLLGVPYGGSLSVSGGITESSITGRVLPIGEGRWLTTPFMEAYLNGGVFLLDEFDGMDANVALVLNSAMSNGGFYVETRTVSGLPAYCPKHANNYILAAMNTFGTGGGAKFTGRNVLDAATLDRLYFIEMDYDDGYEGRLCGENIVVPPWQPVKPLGSNEAPLWRVWVKAVRAKLGTKPNSRFFGRALDKALRARRAGVSPSDVVKALFAGWSETEVGFLGDLAKGPNGLAGVK